MCMEHPIRYPGLQLLPPSSQLTKALILSMTLPYPQGKETSSSALGEGPWLIKINHAMHYLFASDSFRSGMCHSFSQSGIKRSLLKSSRKIFLLISIRRRLTLFALSGTIWLWGSHTVYLLPKIESQENNSKVVREPWHHWTAELANPGPTYLQNLCFMR